MTDSKAPTLDPQFSPQAEPEQVADTYADRLMDELFDGVERALEGDAAALESLTSEAPARLAEAAPAPTLGLSLNFSEGGLPAVLLANQRESELAPLSNFRDPVTAAESSPPALPQTWKRHWTLNRVLLGAAGLTLLATLALWWQQRSQVAVEVSAPAPAPTDTPVVNANAEFLEYLRRSLDVIAQNASDTTVTATTGIPDVTVALNGGAAGLPPIANSTLPLPQTLPGGVPTPAGGINVIERVYIPYATTPTAAPYSPGASAATPNGTAPSASGVAAAPVSAHKLVGVLELGDRSAALFEVDGLPQRVYLGERIGNSGWSLVSVASEEAVVRRNGEVRTLYIGQQF